MENILIRIKKWAKYISVVLFIISLAIFVFASIEIKKNRNIPKDTELRLTKKVREETSNLSEKLEFLSSLTNDLNFKLDDYFRTKNNYQNDTAQVRKLFDSIFQKINQDIFGIGIALDPVKAFEYSPYWYRKNNNINFHQLHDSIPNNNDRPYPYWDRTEPGTTWYHQLISGDPWVHPYFGRRAQSWLFEYGLPILRNCDEQESECDTIGIVYADYSPKIFEQLAQANSGNTSHAYIVTTENKVIYYDNQRIDLDTLLIDLEKTAADQEDNGSLAKFCKKIVPMQRDTSGIMYYQDATQAGSEEWRIFSKIQPTNWTYAFIYNTDEIEVKEASYIRLKFIQITFLLILLISFTYLVLNHITYTTSYLAKNGLARNVWVFSKIVTVFLGFGLIWILLVINSSWPNLYKTNHKISNKHGANYADIVNYEGTARYLNDLGIGNRILAKLGKKDLCGVKESFAKPDQSDLYTNILQISMKLGQIDLISANKIQVSGQVLVKYPSRYKKEDVDCADTCKPPFYFSNTSDENDIKHLSTYKTTIPRKGRNLEREHYVSNWYFNVILHQNLNYDNYPFDVLPLEIKVQPTFSDRELIIPDFDNYYLHAANLYEKGIGEGTSNSVALSKILQSFDNDLKINEWNILSGTYMLRNSSFPNNLKSCDSELVLPPELMHSTVIKRQLFEPLIANYLPLFVISFIVFIVVLRLKTLGIEGVIGTTVGLFFSLLLSHYKLRDELQINTVVYIEYYYFLLYITLISFLVNKYFHLSKKTYALIDYRNNIIAKVVYWPFLLSVTIIFTVIFFVRQI